MAFTLMPGGNSFWTDPANKVGFTPPSSTDGFVGVDPVGSPPPTPPLPAPPGGFAPIIPGEGQVGFNPGNVPDEGQGHPRKTRFVPTGDGQVTTNPVGTVPPADGPVDPATGNPLDADMDAFRKLLDELNPRFMGVADELQGIAGEEDPRFEAFRQVQVGDASARNAEFFGRRGTSGSTASLNQLQRTTTGINANLGMQQLARQDTARLGSLDVLRGFLENETVPIQLQLQRMAAENAATAAEMAGQQRDPFIKLGPISVG